MACSDIRGSFRRWYREWMLRAACRTNHFWDLEINESNLSDRRIDSGSSKTFQFNRTLRIIGGDIGAKGHARTFSASPTPSVHSGCQCDKKTKMKFSINLRSEKFSPIQKATHQETINILIYAAAAAAFAAKCGKRSVCVNKKHCWCSLDMCVSGKKSLGWDVVGRCPETGVEKVIQEFSSCQKHC